MKMYDFNDHNNGTAINHDVILWKAYFYNISTVF